MDGLSAGVSALLTLDIKLGTVKDHVHRILSKTGLDSRAAVAALWRDG